MNSFFTIDCNISDLTCPTMKVGGEGRTFRGGGVDLLLIVGFEVTNTTNCFQYFFNSSFLSFNLCFFSSLTLFTCVFNIFFNSSFLFFRSLSILSYLTLLTCVFNTFFNSSFLSFDLCFFKFFSLICLRLKYFFNPSFFSFSSLFFKLWNTILETSFICTPHPYPTSLN
jgi:hypothetical protein